MRTKKAAMLRKAKYQKHYYNTLKMAASIEEQALMMDEVPEPTFWVRLWPRLALEASLVLFGILSTLLAMVAAKYAEENSDLDPNGVYTGATIIFIAISWAIYILGIRFIQRKEATGLSWVEFIKDLRNSKSEVESLATQLLNRNDPRIAKSLLVATNPDGSVNKRKLMSLMAKGI